MLVVHNNVTNSISILICRSDDESEYSEASEDESEESEDELGSDEESGKDWSDLEREAAEDDANFSNPDAYANKKKSSNDRRDKSKSSKNHR